MLKYQGDRTGAVRGSWGRMSMPRPIFKGDIYLVTRRTAGRQFLLRPSARITPAIEYCIAVAAERSGIRIHALVVMGDHWHCVASDPEARMPEFLRDAHAWIAKIVNSSLGRWESVWSSRQTSLVRTGGDANVLARIAYTMANPVAAGLVEEGSSWPGLRACWPMERAVVQRPDLFSERGPMPPQVELALHRPPGFDGMEEEALNALVREEICALEESHRAAMETAGQEPVGPASILEQSPYDSARSRETRRALSPRVAEKDRWRRAEALQRLRWFLDDYRRALKQWCAGLRQVVFPAGTYALRLHARVSCATI